MQVVAEKNKLTFLFRNDTPKQFRSGLIFLLLIPKEIIDAYVHEIETIRLSCSLIKFQIVK